MSEYVIIPHQSISGMSDNYVPHCTTHENISQMVSVHNQCMCSRCLFAHPTTSSISHRGHHTWGLTSEGCWAEPQPTTDHIMTLINEHPNIINIPRQTQYEIKHSLTLLGHVSEWQCKSLSEG
jgi:hypothetical protein